MQRAKSFVEAISRLWVSQALHLALGEVPAVATPKHHPAYSLLLAHERLDAAVAAAYGWEWSMTDDEILAALLALNLERAAA